MAQSTVLAVGAALVVNGLVDYANLATADLGWVIAGVAAIAVGYLTKGMKW